jgi:succinyl-CoA synthetase beta subunit
MLLLEHDAKELLASADLPVPPGCIVSSVREISDAILPPGPWVVKAQVPTGGRGKAGGIRHSSTRVDLDRTVEALLRSTVRQHPVRECRIETQIRTDREAYISFSIDSAFGGIRILMSAVGGVDIESLNERDNVVMTKTVVSDLARVREAVLELTSQQPEDCRRQLSDAACRLTEVFFAHEATLLEINPLFLFADSSDWIIGDAKMILDENAFTRRPHLRELGPVLN